MGRMLFHAPTPETLPCGAVERAYVAGIEGVPWRSWNQWAGGILTVERSTNESGSLYIPWDVAEKGTRVLSTCSLMERETPYCLATELARGTLHRLRVFVGTIESAGGTVPAEIKQLVHSARQHFFVAITSPFCEMKPAEAAIRDASAAIDQLGQLHNRTSAANGGARSDAHGPVLAGRLDQSVPTKADRFLTAFGGALVPCRWRDLQADPGRIEWAAADAQIAWCRQHDLRVLGGPLVQIDALHLPDWTHEFAADFDALEHRAIHYVDQVASRYEDDVDAWICAGRLNLPGSLGLDEEQKLRIAVSMVETVRRASPRTPVVVGFDQPWGEYLAQREDDLSPLYFADALVRADLGVAGIALEINLGYWPGGTQPRDLLEIMRHLDRWCLLGIPLIVLLTLPAAMGDDPNAVGAARIVPRSRHDDAAPAMDQTVVADMIRSLMGCSRLHAVVWNQWSDARPHEFPHSGLLDSSGQERPGLESFVAVRREFSA